MSTSLASDTHFGDAKLREMDAALIARWNETVGPGDDVWHLGDFAARMPEAALVRLIGSAPAARPHCSTCPLLARCRQAGVVNLR